MSTRVRMRVPHDATTLIGPTGDQVTVKTDEAGPYADMLEDDACLILFSGLPASVPWRESNLSLVQMLKPPPRTPAVRVADLERAADMAKPINPFDRASIARDALAIWRGRR
jgi:hypothetical protein